MKVYETIHLVKGEDLNHHGTLFAARAAAWFVEAGFAAAACENGNTDEVVLRNVHNMSFVRPVPKGAVIRFQSRVAYAGKTSIVVYVEASHAITGEPALEGYITFVTVDAVSRNKIAHGLVLDPAVDEREQQIREQCPGSRVPTRLS